MIAGVDEAGRGALAGPVIAAAVILPVEGLPGLGDSKKLTPRRREQLATAIRSGAVAWAVRAVDAATIDAINILQASLRAMAEAVAALEPAPSEVLVDGLQLPKWEWPARAIVGGDASEPAIMAASILAKVHRDALMVSLDAHFPGYGFAGHKGYPTAAHQAALHCHGVSAAHRRSYAPVRRCLAEAAS